MLAELQDSPVRDGPAQLNGQVGWVSRPRSGSVAGMKERRRQGGPDGTTALLRAKVALAALKGDKTMSDPATRFDVRPNLIAIEDLVVSRLARACAFQEPRADRSPSLSISRSAIAKDEVAAGDGALSTCSIRALCAKAKSCSISPDRVTAWARIPAG